MIKGNTEYVVYLHVNAENGDVFYVGIGKSEKRAYQTIQRTNFWKNYIQKHKYNVVFYEKQLTWEDAVLIERELIRKYGRRLYEGGTLVNMTMGGEGRSGYKLTENQRSKISNSRLKLFQTNDELLKKNQNMAAYARSKIKKDENGKPYLSEEGRRKISESSKNRIITDEYRHKLSVLRKQTNGMKGRTWNEEERKRMSIARLGGKTKNAKPVKNLKTGEIFPSPREAYIKQAFQFSIDHFRNMLNGHRKNTTDYIKITSN